MLNLKEEILKVLSKHKKGIHIDKIVNEIISLNNDLFSGNEIKDREQIKTEINSILYRDVKKKSGNEFAKANNPKTGKEGKGWYKLKFARTEHILPGPKEPKTGQENKKGEKETKPTPEPIDFGGSNFIGKAGECAVMSELLFRGYNSNLMMVDDGVDIVASKNNMYYFIQVKSTSIKDNGTIHQQIKTDRFDAFITAQIRYVVVARCNISGIDTNLYFVFNNKDISQFIFKKLVHINENSIFIKIKIDKSNGNKPFLYNDSKEEDISFFMNNFNL